MSSYYVIDDDGVSNKLMIENVYGITSIHNSIFKTVYLFWKFIAHTINLIPIETYLNLNKYLNNVLLAAFIYFSTFFVLFFSIICITRSAVFVQRGCVFCGRFFFVWFNYAVEPNLV